jgi:Peptidase family M23
MRRLLPTLIAFLLLTSPANAAWVWPVDGEVITPYRNGTDPYATGQHRGIDIAAPVGTSVVAAAGGEVRFAGTAGSSGVTISIRTADGYDTSYLHLSSLVARTGAHVSAGDRIGTVGTTGTRSATAPHLHFGVRDAGTRHDYHDPLAFLPPPPAQPSPEPPPAAPAPAVQPAPPAATPVTAPVGTRSPSSRPAPQRHSAPRSVPVRERRPLPDRDPRPLPHNRPLPRPYALRQPDALPHGTPGSRRAAPRAPNVERSPAAGRLGHPTSDAPNVFLDPDSATTSGTLRAVPPADHRTRRGQQAEDGGPDLGWMAACAGLLLAAALLGITAETPARRRRGRSAAALLRPLIGRR